MRALISAASKHGSTEEIGAAIARVLRGSGIEAENHPPAEVRSLESFDAAILGSAVYAGHWLKEAMDLVDRLGPDLRSIPVWLFSSGPIGDPPKPDEDPVDVDALMEATAAAGHVIFSGRLDKGRLGFGERAIVAAFHAPEGDFRDWEVIEAWAEAIARSLRDVVVS